TSGIEGWRRAWAGCLGESCMGTSASLAPRIGPAIPPLRVPTLQELLPFRTGAGAGVRLRPQRRPRLHYNLELPAVDDPSQAEGLPGVQVLRVDTDGALGSVVTLALDRLANGADVVTARRPHCLGPDVDAEVGRLHRVRGHSLRAVLGLKAVHELAVLWAIDALKVIPGGIVADHVPHGQAAQ